LATGDRPVDLCLPPNCTPKQPSRRSGGKRFVEKPMGLTAAECDQMVAAAKKARKQILVGHVLPFLPEYAFAWKAITGGKYGKVLGGHFKRVISDPSWLKDFFNPKKVGGPLVDLMCTTRISFGYCSACRRP
jgi:hypothetical protein